ncbi:MAG: 5'-methylthioadenosine phosphorylase [Gracilibacter sp. BRH_c7a]|nr:MAG: 5'-methylthioadenosine phosphorylase [Gracilibacter sp. BRH_c7a]
MDLALIGGTGVQQIGFQHKENLDIETPYGTVNINVADVNGTEMAFLKRHGEGHTVPPHRINYRGNIWALKQIGVKRILATGAVGSLCSNFQVGEVTLIDQFLDFTKNRTQTFYEGGEQGVLHVDVSQPYCPDLREIITQAAQNINLNIKTSGVYVCTEGPRFETPAEIKMFRMLGGELVGMTGVPEVVLARELGMCYATIALVTNAAAGIINQPLTHAEVIDTMNVLGETVAKLVENTCTLLNKEQKCYCATSNKEAGLF